MVRSWPPHAERRPYPYCRTQSEHKIVVSLRHVGVAKTPPKQCRKYQPGSPFSRDLECKRCIYYAFGRFNGRKIRQSLETTERQEAAKKLLEMEANAKAPVRYTVSEAVCRFTTEMEGSGYAAKSVLRYKYSLNRLIEFLSTQGVTQLRSVTVDHLAAWKLTWKEQTDLGKRKEQERLRTFFRWCCRRKYILEDPAEGLTRIRADIGGKRERFTDGEIDKIFAVIPEIYPNKTEVATVRAFLLTLQYTALRIGDATNLQRSHLIGDRLLLRTTKTGQAVFTVVPPVLVEALSALNNGSEYYFWERRDTTLESAKKRWSKILRPIYEKAGVKFRSHAWRDTLVYKMLRGGVPIEIIARLLGHASVNMTWTHYSAWVPELQQRLETAVRGAIHQT
jgi:integrase